MSHDRSEPRHAAPEAMPIHRPFGIATLKRGHPTLFDLQAGPAERDAIARFLGLARLREFRFRGQIRPLPDSGWQVAARLSADFDQTCVATLDPVPARVDISVARGFVPGGSVPEIGAKETIVDIDADEDDVPDIYVDVIDPAHVAVEELALALDPWPRTPGTDPVDHLAGPPGASLLDDDAIKPFAGLAALKARMEGN